MTDSEFLAAVLEKVSTPETWSKNSYFRNRRGQPIWPEAEYPNASQWSLSGAAQAVSGYQSGASNRLARLLGFPGVHELNDWNDYTRRRHSEILSRITNVLEAMQ